MILPIETILVQYLRISIGLYKSRDSYVLSVQNVLIHLSQLQKLPRYRIKLGTLFNFIEMSDIF